MLSGSANKCGIYSIELYVDDSLIQHQQMDKLDFNKGRFINCHTDFRQFQRAKSSIHKCYLEPNNKLPIYPVSQNRGKLSFRDNKAHPIRFVVKDVYGNTSVLNDTVYSTVAQPARVKAKPETEKEWAWNRRYNPKTADYEIDFPAECLFRNEPVKISDKPGTPNLYSRIVIFGDDEIAMNGSYTIKLNRRNLPDSLLPFAFVAQLNENNRITRMAGNKRDATSIGGTARTFGRFAIAIDTVSPTISPVNIAEGKEFYPLQTISFSSSDALTGIEAYNLYIDNTWALISYDAKYDRFSYTIDPGKILPGVHRLQFVVTDGVGNSRTFECNFLLR